MLLDEKKYIVLFADLFYWDNDLENDTERLLKLNSDSRFFSGLKELEMESRIRPLLHWYADFDFAIDYERSAISFFREVLNDGISQQVDNIKISRGEENIFVWCFFLAIVQLVVDKVESYHFNILRNILEKTASFHGYAHFSSCIRKGDEENEPVYTRIVNLLSHGNYSLFENQEEEK